MWYGTFTLKFVFIRKVVYPKKYLGEKMNKDQVIIIGGGSLVYI